MGNTFKRSSGSLVCFSLFRFPTAVWGAIDQQPLSSNCFPLPPSWLKAKDFLSLLSSPMWISKTVFPFSGLSNYLKLAWRKSQSTLEHRTSRAVRGEIDGCVEGRWLAPMVVRRVPRVKRWGSDSSSKEILGLAQGCSYGLHRPVAPSWPWEHTLLFRPLSPLSPPLTWIFS